MWYPPEQDIDRAAVMKAFGGRVREVRGELGISQDELAFRCGLHRTYLGGVERGERNVSLVNICRIARTLGVSVSTLTDCPALDAPPMVPR